MIDYEIWYVVKWYKRSIHYHMTCNPHQFQAEEIITDIFYDANNTIYTNE